MLLYCLFVLCSCVFMSCSDDELTLEEMKQALVGEWDYLEEETDGVSSYLGCPLIFNSDGTGAELHWKIDVVEQEYVEFTYELVQMEPHDWLGEEDTGLYLYIKHSFTDLVESRYVLEITPNRFSWKASPITCDMPKQYKKVK